MNATRPIATVIGNLIFVPFPSSRPANAPPATDDVRRVRRAVRRRIAREMAVSDDVLVEQMIVGDSAALDALKDRFADHLLTAANAFLEDGEEAENVVAQVFEEASQGWPPERGHVKSWLTRLTRRAARARRRALEGFDDR